MDCAYRDFTCLKYVAGMNVLEQSDLIPVPPLVTLDWHRWRVLHGGVSGVPLSAERGAAREPGPSMPSCRVPALDLCTKNQAHMLPCRISPCSNPLSGFGCPRGPTVVRSLGPSRTYQVARLGSSRHGWISTKDTCRSSVCPIPSCHVAVVAPKLHLYCSSLRTAYSLVELNLHRYPRRHD